MSVTVGVNERLAALTEAGTSVWLDQIRRSMIEGGELQRLIDEYSLRGVTSNPAIFEKAILGSSDYDDQIVELAEAGHDARGIYDEVAVTDVRLGCDVLRGVWDETGGVDGYVSLEVGPEAARDTEETLRQARDYWQRVDRPNLFIKIPGTPEGVPAIEQAIAEGINVNITLLFAVSAYEAIAEAYVRGLERRREAGESLDVHSVASFFVSRVDSEVDTGEVERMMGRLADAGIDIDDVTDKLLRDGVRLFEVALDKLLAGVESKREAVVTGKPETIESVIPDDLEPAIAERVKKAAQEDVARRVWRKDETLWGGPGPELGDRLGWLTVSDTMLERAGEQPLRGDHGPGHRARRAGRGARVPAHVPERPGDRRPLLGAVVLRAGPGGADGRRRGGGARARAGGRAGLPALRPQLEQLGAVAGRGDGRAGAPPARQAHVRGGRPDRQL